MARPWWLDRVDALLRQDLAMGLGPLWHLREQLHFVRDNVETASLALDVRSIPEAGATWARFEARELEVSAALGLAGETQASEVRSHRLGPGAFRAHWENLGFVRHAEGAGTPADDYLDALLDVSRRSTFSAPAPFALLNLATRAARIADFLSVMKPGVDDVVFDLGSGSGKLTLTVAASAVTTVRGVEIDAGYARHAQESAAWLGLTNVTFEAADVLDVSLAEGTVFYLYYPFHGRVARQVAQRLGALAREKAIRVYAAGPELEFGEFFLEALELVERRGEFGEVMCLRSPAPPEGADAR